MGPTILHRLSYGGRILGRCAGGCDLACISLGSCSHPFETILVAFVELFDELEHCWFGNILPRAKVGLKDFGLSEDCYNLADYMFFWQSFLCLLSKLLYLVDAIPQICYRF